MIERRQAPRQRVFKQGKLTFAGGGGPCVVRNISPGGARIDNVNPVGLPATFALAIKGDGLPRRCRPVWIKDGQMGVAFD